MSSSARGGASAVRAQLHPDEPPPRWSGVMMWRGTAEGRPFLSGSTLAITGSTSSVKFVAYPIGPRSGPDWNSEGGRAGALPYFKGWTFDWLDVPGLMSRSPEILEYPMVDRDPLPSRGRGRGTLMGDAAAPVYPIGSNGGSQAIIDARVLARELAAAASPADGLAAYEAERPPAGHAIVLAPPSLPGD